MKKQTKRLTLSRIPVSTLDAIAGGAAPSTYAPCITGTSKCNNSLAACVTLVGCPTPTGQCSGN